ncbi:MAG: SLC13 family permease [Fuerstiella sp.]|nr:SLC13 family permease [Fuerstiella sp.]
MEWLAVTVTLLVIAASIVGIMFYRLPADITLLGALTILLIYGVFDRANGLSIEDGLKGFANPGVLTVAVLFVLADGLYRTGAFEWLGLQLLGVPKSQLSAQMRAMVPAAVLSAFLNNTPVVALMMPIINDWSRKYRISVSHLFLPLSYAAILGGTCTLIGTSTTIVINNQLREEMQLSMFELSIVGLPSLIVGLGFIAAATRWLLPERRPAFTAMDDPREYTVEMIVQAGSPLVGKSIEAAGLRHLSGMYLMEINRRGTVIPAVGSETMLQARDQLVFVGVVSSVVDLQRIPGLEPAIDPLFQLDGPRSLRRLVEAVVSTSYPFLRMTVRDSEFRSHYNAAIIAVSRDGVRLTEKIGDIRLEPGDTILLEATDGFAKQQRNSRHFFLVSEVQNSSPVRHEHAWTARFLMFSFVLAASVLTRWLPGSTATLLSALLVALLMILFRCTRASEARRSVDWNVITVMAAGIGIGKAMDVSGADDFIIQQLTHIVGQNPHAMLTAVFIIASLLSNMITAKAAAVITLNIAQAASESLGVLFAPFAIAVIMGCAACFATPFGYQTNMMVYGPGGYRSSDYLRLGVPLTILVGIVTLLIAPWVWPF